MSEQNKKIMVYMGSYIKDRSEGKYNDHVTYDGDCNADYKSYMDLETGEVHNIDMDEIARFENKIEKFDNKNIIIKMPIVSNSYDSYLSSYMKLRKWYLEEIKTHGKEEVIEELREKYEKKIKLNELKNTRETLKVLESELSKINEQREKLLKKKEYIEGTCNHEIVVKLDKFDIAKNSMEEFTYKRAVCLLCNKIFGNPFRWDFDILFKNMIHFEDEEFSNISEEERIEIALKMFEEERKANPDLSDSKIVEIINNRLKKHKEYIRGKVLINKPEIQN